MHSCIYRLFSNKSVDLPEAFLDRDTLKSFFGTTGEEGSLNYIPETERIPKNWYIRAIDDPYGVPFLISDSKNLVRQHSEISVFDGNPAPLILETDLDITNLTVSLFV